MSGSTRAKLLNTALVVVSLLVALGACEVALRAIEAWRTAPVADDYTTTALRLHRPSTDRMLLYETRPGATVRWKGTTYRINDEGLRRDQELGAKDGERRVLVIGDSLAFGIGVESEQTFAHRLEVLLSRSQPTVVLNQAVLGYRTAQEVRLYEHRRHRLAPDAVVLAFCLNDFDVFSGEVPVFDDAARLELGFRRMAPRRTFGVDWPEPLRLADRSLLFRKVTDRLLRLDYYRWIGTDPRRRQDVASAFDRLGRMLAKDGVPGLVAIFPLLMVDGSGAYAYRDVHDFVRTAARDAGLATVDLLDAWTPARLPSLRLAPDDVLHLSPEGHELAAATLAPCLEAPDLRCPDAR